MSIENLFVENALQKASTLSLSSLSYTVPDNTTATVNALFGSKAKVKVLEIPIPGAATGHYAPLTRLRFTGGSFTTTSTINSLALVAYTVGCTASTLLGANLPALQGTSLNKSLPVGTILSLPVISYTVLPDTPYYIAHYFGVAESDVSGTCTPGQSLTISNISYTLPEATTLAALGNSLCIADVATLSAALADQALWIPGIALSSPAFSYTTLAGDTPQGLVQSFGAELSTLMFNNLTALFPAGTNISVPQATVPVQALMQELLAGTVGASFDNIAGLVTRFLLHGLRLPIPEGTPQNPNLPVLNPDQTPNTSVPTESLYALTGQQIDPGTASSLELTNPNSKSWITFAGGAASTPVNSGTIADWLSALKSNGVSLTMTVQPYTLYRKATPRFALQHPIVWSVPDQPQYLSPSQNPSAAVVNPTLWPFPSDLKKKLQAEGPITLSLHTGANDPSGLQNVVSTPVSSCRWATLLDVKVRQIKSSFSSSGQLHYLYRIDGLKNEEERHLLMGLIQSCKSASQQPDVRFLFDSAQGGVCSDHLVAAPGGGDEVRLLKANLSTVVPEAQPFYTLASQNLAPVAASSPSPLTGMDITSGVSFADASGQSRTAWQISFPQITTAGDYGCYNWADTDQYQKVNLPDSSANATGLSFWVCGKKGGEIVQFGITIPDGNGGNGGTKALTQTFILTANWKEYTLSFADLGLDALNPEWWKGIQVPFNCAISNVQANPGAIEFAIDQTTGIQMVGNPPPMVEAGLSQGLDFLELLWEGSLLQDGGFYLQYQNAQGTGLPDSLFSQGPESNVKLLALCPLNTTKVGPYYNAVALQTPAPQDAVLYAQADHLNEYHTLLKPGNLGINLSCAIPPTPPSGPSSVFAIADNGSNSFSPCMVGGTGCTPVQGPGGAWAYLYPASGTQKKANVWQTGAGSSGAWVVWAKDSSGTPMSVPAGASSIVFWMIANQDNVQITVKGWSDASHQPTDHVITLHKVWTRYEIPIQTSYPAQIVSAFAFASPPPNTEFAIAMDAADFAYVNESLSPTQVKALVQSSYSLITAQISPTSDFKGSSYALPAGPVQQPGRSGTTWDFNHVFPVAKLSTASGGTAVPGFPDPTQNPYKAVGGTLDLDFYFQDLFGNLATKQKQALPAAYQTITYFDRLIAPSQWTGVASSYDFSLSKAGKPQLNAYLHYDASRYLPVGQKNLSDYQQQAQKDLPLLQSLFYQLSAPKVSLEVQSSLGSLGQPASALDDVVTFVGQIFQWATTMASLKSVTAAPSTSLPALKDLAKHYHLDIVDLALANATLPDVFDIATIQTIEQPTFHTVKFGDCIQSIAASPLSPVSWATGLAATKDILRPGTVLTIDTTANQVYTIQSGDTFNAIVTHFVKAFPSLTLDTLITQNETVPNLFRDSIALPLSSTSVAPPEGATTLQDIATQWKITVEQLAQANAATALNTAVSLTIPEAYTLSNPMPANSSVLTLGSNLSLQSIAQAQSTAVEDLYTANQGLTGVLAASPVTFSNSGSPLSYTPDAQDTLNTVFQYFTSQVEGLALSSFLVQLQTQNLFTTAETLLLPPAQVEWNCGVQASYAPEVFEISASLCVKRTDYIDAAVPADLPEVREVVTRMTPHMQDVNGAPLSLKHFAKHFEKAFSSQIKMAIYRDTAQAGTQAKHLWAVPVVEVSQPPKSNPNPNTLAYYIDNSPVYFAPAPLANQSLNRNGVQVPAYRTGVGLGNSLPVNFHDVDLDQWAGQFLDALHSFSQAGRAAVTSDLSPTAFANLMQAKQLIAESVAGSVIPVLESDASDLVSRQQIAQQSLEERLLQDISSAYKVESIVQLDVQTQNASGDLQTAPRLTGKPVLQQYTINPSQDSLGSLAANAFEVPVTAEYLGLVLSDRQGLLASAALTAQSFAPIAGLSSQDSANIFAQLVVNKILTDQGVLASGVQPGTTDLKLNVVYQNSLGAINQVLQIAQTEQSTSTLSNSGNSVTPTSQGTLNSLNTILKYSSLDTFVEAIAGEKILSAQVLGLSWNYTNPSPTDTLGTLADRFNCTLSQLVQANMANPNFLTAQKITVAQQSYTITAGETLASLLTSLGVQYADFDTGTNSACVQLANMTGLIQSQAKIGVLAFQSALNLSSAELPLTQDSSFLTFLLEKPAKGTLGENAFLSLAYQVNGLLQESGATLLPGFEDYASYSFVLPPAASPTLSMEVPIPLREVPQKPSLLAQSALLPAAGSSDLSSLKQWAYEIDFDQMEQSQDEAEVCVAFNSQSSTDNLSSVVSSTPDLFSALASFMYNWPALQTDLNSLSKLSESLPLNPNVQKGVTVAVESFASLALNIAQMWIRWKEDKATDQNENAQYRCALQEFSDGANNFGVHIRSLNNNIPLNAIPDVELPDSTTGKSWKATQSLWTLLDYSSGQQVEVSSFPTTGTYQVLEVILTNFEQGTNTLTYAQAKQTHARRFKLKNLNVIQTYNVWGGVAMSRNMNLINGYNTNPAFIYQTPWVRFIAPASPHIVSSTALDISTLPSVSGGGTALEDYLSNLFCDLLELSQVEMPTRAHQLQLSCQYIFGVAGSGALSTDLVAVNSVLMHPQYTFSIHDWELSTDPGAKQSFVQRLAASIQSWQQQAQPNTQASNCYYRFAINVLSGDSETDKLLNFLVRNNTSNLPGALSRTEMPLSFYVPKEYWVTPPNEQQDPYTVNGVTERVLATYGADIYDVATAQIALSLFPNFEEGYSMAENWTRRLNGSTSGVLNSIRGWSKSKNKAPFLYGGASIPSPLSAQGGNAGAGAYFFRMIADQWYLPDPLTGGTQWPDGHTAAGTTDITWTDWKPITGENAWGAILGPLQWEYSKSGGRPDWNSQALQLAQKVLPAYDAMQYKGQSGKGSRGAIYYAPENTAANTGGQVDPYGVSNENNFSSFSALTTFMEVLSNIYARQTQSSVRKQIAAVFTQVQTLACGILDYFQHNLLDLSDPANPCFYTGGSYADSTSTPTKPVLGSSFIPGGASYPFAVDVHTWGCAVLGIDNVDKWFASKSVTVYDLWQTVKKRAGYFVDGDTSKAILGVGYTDVPTDPTILKGAKPHAFIISAEWTFGAINMCRVIGGQYLDKSRVCGDPTQAKTYANYAASLHRDAETMMSGVRNLLLDTSRSRQDIFAYYYANRRYDIPFGWYSNRVDSLCSTSWGVMVLNHYNPFILAGSYAKRVIDPTTYTVESWNASVLTQLQKPAALSEAAAAGVPTPVQGLVRFLVLNNTHNLRDPNSQYSTGMPLSFYNNNQEASQDYWKQLTNPNSHVYDPTYANCSGTIAACTERVLVHYGVDIYDAATMQCALSVFPDYTAGILTAQAQTRRLLSGFSIPNTFLPVATQAPQSTVRGWSTDASGFYYGQYKTSLFPSQGNAGPGAYFYRSISDQFHLTDPLTGSTKWPGGAKVNGSTSISWTDWKPITGENAWAALISPLQTAYSACGGIPPMDDEAVQLALLVLPAYQAMASPSGGIFYGPWNMYGNSGDSFADPFQLSNENNFSSLAGLTMLQTVLQANGDTTYLPQVNALITGIENYFKTCLYDSSNNVFYTGGTYAASTSTSSNPVWGGKFTPGGSNFAYAVDVHTWGCAVLGVDRVDTWFGTGTSYQLWQTVKQRAGYFVDGDTSKAILGVGYTDVPTDPKILNGAKPHAFIISAEWSFGAVNMCRVLAAQYGDSSSPHHNAQHAASLLEDAASMMQGIQDLLLDQDKSIDSLTQAYYYANRRYDIPFGWYANRVDSLCSTAWGVMMHNDFNPFVLGGGTDTSQVLQPHWVYGASPVNKPSLQLNNLLLELKKISIKQNAAVGSNDFN